MILAVLGLIGMVMISNLLFMVIGGGYESGFDKLPGRAYQGADEQSKLATPGAVHPSPFTSINKGLVKANAGVPPSPRLPSFR